MGIADEFMCSTRFFFQRGTKRIPEAWGMQPFASAFSKYEIQHLRRLRREAFAERLSRS